MAGGVWTERERRGAPLLMSTLRVCPLDSRLGRATYVEPEGSQYRSTRRLKPDGYNLPLEHYLETRRFQSLRNGELLLTITLFVYTTQCHVFFLWGPDVVAAGDRVDLTGWPRVS